jgi:hypothetical protein
MRLIGNEMRALGNTERFLSDPEPRLNNNPDIQVGLEEPCAYCGA